MNITDIITEAVLDNRITDGIINLSNPTHVQVVAENMYDSGIDEETINEFVKKFMEEGKYPDRQAYNKEGWLVTFPSKQYRDTAIKKRTHFISDPTHGAGGMNLYYKKKGKQQRQTQQNISSTDDQNSIDQGQVSAKTSSTPPPLPQKTTDPSPPEESPEESPETAPVDADMGPEELGPEDSEQTSGGSPSHPSADSSSSALPPAEKSSETSQSAENPVAPSPAPTTPPPPPFVELSKKFAQQKGWTATPYGEWRNAQGESSAVVGLTGEVVPVKTVDREEFKIFAEKQVGT